MGLSLCQHVQLPAQKHPALYYAEKKKQHTEEYINCMICMKFEKDKPSS